MNPLYRDTTVSRNLSYESLIGLILIAYATILNGFTGKSNLPLLGRSSHCFKIEGDSMSTHVRGFSFLLAKTVSESERMIVVSTIRGWGETRVFLLVRATPCLVPISSHTNLFLSGDLTCVQALFFFSEERDSSILNLRPVHISREKQTEACIATFLAASNVTSLASLNTS